MDSKFKKCRRCGKVGLKHYWDQGSIVCGDCIPYVEQIFTDKIQITEAGPILVQPECAADEDRARGAFIDFVYILFDQKISPAAFKLMDKYRKKGYTWLGLMRSMEYFYIVKRNSIDKANGNIGIIPHVYDQAQFYYKFLGEDALAKSRRWWETKDREVKETKIEKHDTKKGKEINMQNLI